MKSPLFYISNLSCFLRLKKIVYQFVLVGCLLFASYTVEAQNCEFPKIKAISVDRITGALESKAPFDVPFVIEIELPIKDSIENIWFYGFKKKGAFKKEIPSDIILDKKSMKKDFPDYTYINHVPEGGGFKYTFNVEGKNITKKIEDIGMNSLGSLCHKVVSRKDGFKKIHVRIPALQPGRKFKMLLVKYYNPASLKKITKINDSFFKNRSNATYKPKKDSIAYLAIVNETNDKTSHTPTATVPFDVYRNFYTTKLDPHYLNIADNTNSLYMTLADSISAAMLDSIRLLEKGIKPANRMDLSIFYSIENGLLGARNDVYKNMMMGRLSLKRNFKTAEPINAWSVQKRIAQNSENMICLRELIGEANTLYSLHNDNDSLKKFSLTLEKAVLFLAQENERLKKESGKILKEINAVSDIRSSKYEGFGTDDYKYTDETESGYWIIPDMGLLAMYHAKNGKDKPMLRPYFGFNISLRAINKDLRIGDLKRKSAIKKGNRDAGLAYQSWRHRLSLSIGVTIGVFDDDELIDDYYNSTSFIFGVGYRWAKFYRFTAGTVLHKRMDLNPLITNSDIAFSPFISFSADLDVVRLFDKIKGVVK